MNSTDSTHDNFPSTIVLIEANATAREFYLSALGQIDMASIQSFESGQEFLNALQEGSVRCDVLIVDLNDTQPAGYVLIQKIRANLTYDHIDIVASARTVSDNDLVLFNEYGIQAWFQKQSEVGNLVEKIIETLIQRRMELPLVQKLRKLELFLREAKVSLTDELAQTPDVYNAITSDPRYLFLYAEYLILNKQVEQAIQFMKNALTYHSSSKHIEQFKNLNALAKALCLAGQFVEAEEIYTRLSEKSPKNLSHKISVGDVQLSQGNSTGAREQFEAVVNADPHHNEAHIGLAKVELFDGKIQSAEAQLQLVDGPIESYSLASFFNNRAVTFVRMGRVDDAIELYKTALKYLSKYQGLIHFNLGLAYTRLGRTQEAELCYREAVSKEGSAFANRKAALNKKTQQSEDQFLINKQEAS